MQRIRTTGRAGTELRIFRTCCVRMAEVAGGAFVGTLATHALAPAPALKASYVAAEKMQPAFEVCAPSSLAAQSPAISARAPPPFQCLYLSNVCTCLIPALWAQMTTEKLAVPAEKLAAQDEELVAAPAEKARCKRKEGKRIIVYEC